MVALNVSLKLKLFMYLCFFLVFLFFLYLSFFLFLGGGGKKYVEKLKSVESMCEHLYSQHDVLQKRIMK